MDVPSLFPDFDPSSTSPADQATSQAAQTKVARRLRRPDREQGEIRCESLDMLLPPDDPARIVWRFVETLDLQPLIDQIQSVEGRAGRDALDPQVPMALWLLATIEGIGSARALDEQCGLNLRYRWICGGLSVNYHSLSDFRTAHPQFLESVLVDTVASMLREGLVSLTEVAQDGMRVRASAGASSFRREPSLKECLKKAQTQLDSLKAEADAEASGQSASQRTAREKAARERANQDRTDRIQRALDQRQQLLDQRQQQKVEKGVKFDAEKIRTSTTDPDARRIKMPDGGTRPAFNFQFASATGSGIVVGVAVTNSGSDAGQMGPMIDGIKDDYGISPDRSLVDGGFAVLDDIEHVQTTHETKVYAPVKDEKKKLAKGENPYQPKPKDSPSIADWRLRMGTPEAKEIYKRRAQTAEWVNAGMRQRGLYQVVVRGLSKVTSVAYWHAIAHNLLRAVVLRAMQSI